MTTAYAGVLPRGRALVDVVRELGRDTRDAFTASDPGLLRLRLAVRAGLAVLLVLVAERLVAPAVGIPTVVAMLFGGMVAMNGSFAASSRRPLDAALTVGAFPLVGAVGLVPAVLLHGHAAAELTGFVVVMVGAVYLRRFGPRWFNYGMFLWMAYFFTVFVGFTTSQALAVLAVLAAAAACVVLVAAVLVPERPERVLAATVRAYELRVDALLAAGHAALAGRVERADVSRVLHGRAFRVVEAALLVDGHLAADAVGGPPAAAVRQRLLVGELAAEELASAAGQLAQADDVPPAALAALLDGLDAARGRVRTAVERAADRVETAAGAARDTTACSHTAQRLGDAAEALRRLSRSLPGSDVHLPAHLARYEPAVPLFLGNLPGAAPSATSALQGGSSWWAGRSLNTRLCVQVALAASLTVLAGHALSSQRYYWAVLACFLTMTGTFTTGETLVKGASRVIGTVLGLVAATVAVHVTGRNDTAVIAVMVLCIVLGLYLFRVSYVFMAFAVTTVMGELYNVLSEFSDALLVLRLEETAVGAGIGIVVALLVLPIRTADAQAAAERALLDALVALLADVRDRLRSPHPTSDLLLDARRVDARLHQLALVARPSAGATLLGLSGRRAERDLSRWTATAYRARGLADAVSRGAAGADPALAGEVEGLREAVAARRAPPEATRDTSGPLDRALVDLRDVVEPILVPRR